MQNSSAITLLALLTLTAATLTAADWPNWRGPNRDLICTETGLLKQWPEDGPPLLWQAELPASGYSTPAILGNKLYITGSTGDKKARRGILSCLDKTTGKILWSQDYGSEWGESFEMARTTPTLHNGKVYVMSGTGVLACLDAADGKILWSLDTAEKYGRQNATWGYAESPYIYDGKVIATPGGTTASIVALNSDTGKEIWKTFIGKQAASYCTPTLGTLDGKQQLITFFQNCVTGFDPKTGTKLWSYDYKNKHSVHPNPPLIVGPNQLYLTSGYGYGSHCLEIKNNTPKLLWENKTDNHFQGAALRDGIIYTCGSRPGGIALLNPKDGSVIDNIKEAGKATYILIPGGLISYSEKDGAVRLCSVDSKGACKVVSEFKLPYGEHQHWSSPIVVDGVLYIRHGAAIGAYQVKLADK